MVGSGTQGQQSNTEADPADDSTSANELRGVHRLWRPSHVAFVVAVLLSPLVFRTLLLAENEVRFRRADVQGVYLDLCVSTVFVLAAVLVGALTRVGVYVLVVLWCMAHYSNYENVRALGATIQFENAFQLGDATFLKGSALVLSRPLWLAALLAISLGAAWWALPFRRLDRQVWKAFAMALLVLAATPLCKTRDVAHWREASFLIDNLQALVHSTVDRGIAREVEYKEPSELSSQLDPLFQTNLQGAPRIEIGRGKQNVLLVVIEGISGAYIEAIRKRHGVEYDVAMPRLSRLCEENLAWTQFVTHNRQTNRGLWALLSGTYDGMTVQTTARMTEYTGEDERRLLPHILRDNGYETVYLQAAPLGFMQKDRFMPRAGFNRVMGDEAFDNVNCRLRTRWGPDDRSLFEKASQVVNNLQRNKQPWFLTVLTAGTHHPFTVPADYDGPGATESFGRAAGYADLAVGEFVDRLKKSGVLKNTLVLITSDESAGMQSYQDELLLNLSQNWGFLVALTPEKSRGAFDDLIVQSDMSLSILDYLGLADQPHHFGGRSYFRQYVDSRPIYLANHYFRQMALFDDHNMLLLCRDDWTDGRKYKFSGNCLFGGTYQKRTYKAEECEVVRAMAHRAATRAPFASPKMYQLASQPQYTISDSSRTCLVFGGQYLSLRPQTVIKVNLDLDVVADKNVLVDLEHRLSPHRPSALKYVHMEEAAVDSQYVLNRLPLRPYLLRSTPCFVNGGRCRLSYYYYNLSGSGMIECNLTAVKRTPGFCQIKVRDASLELVPAASWKGPALTNDTARVTLEKYAESGWKNLQGLCQGSSLDLSKAWVDDAWLKTVSELSELEELTLDGANITDEGLKRLSSMTNLRKLSLNRTKVTNQGLLYLQELPQLQEVSLRDTQVTDEGIKLLRGARPNSLATRLQSGAIAVPSPVP